ncbi:hypothetical protein J1N35_041136, partial [Gossypium stocksii]
MKGDGPRVKRLLQAVYHPRNYYMLHIDLEASDSELMELAKYVKSESVVGEFENVTEIVNADLVTYKGPTVIASTFHAVVILLKESQDWDWFVNLSASDYPLMSLDGTLKKEWGLWRELLKESSGIGWCLSKKTSGVFWVKEKRSLPSSFKLFM